jgi:tetratricopeptide (TPR) repeat protein
MNQTLTGLSSDEYWHIAITSIREGNHQAALVSLKAGVVDYPEEIKLHFLLGAEYAQLGMFEPAQQHFRIVLALEPGLHVARFQLGLLQITHGRIDDAKAVWQELEILPSNHSLRLFKEGVEALIVGDRQMGREKISTGISLNGFSEELNRDMTGVLDRLDLTSGAAVVTTESTSGHILLNAYQTQEK